MHIRNKTRETAGDHRNKNIPLHLRENITMQGKKQNIV